MCYTRGRRPGRGATWPSDDGSMACVLELISRVAEMDTKRPWFHLPGLQNPRGGRSTSPASPQLELLFGDSEPNMAR